METEMTNELKEQFIAQYWGQNVFHRDDLVFHNEPVNANSLQFIEDSYLGLKSLASITDEDAIESCKAGHRLTFMGNNPVSKWVCKHSDKNFISITTKYSSHSFEFDKEGCPLIDMYIDGDLTNSFSNEFAYQYLQSKGYALPFMGISVEQQVQSGWVKLIENAELTELPDKPLTECMMGRDCECNHPQCPVTDEDEKNGKYCTLPLYDYRE